jgi:hypothetical protein
LTLHGFLCIYIFNHYSIQNIYIYIYIFNNNNNNNFFPLFLKNPNIALSFVGSPVFFFMHNSGGRRVRFFFLFFFFFYLCFFLSSLFFFRRTCFRGHPLSLSFSILFSSVRSDSCFFLFYFFFHVFISHRYQKRRIKVTIFQFFTLLYKQEEIHHQNFNVILIQNDFFC